MTEQEKESRRSKGRGRGPGVARYVYGGLLVAIGACIGIVIGSLSETPRLLLERLRGPVETVDFDAPSRDAAKQSPPLEAFDALQGGSAKPKAERAVAAGPPAPTPPPVTAPPVTPPPTTARAVTPPPAVSSPPPPAPAKSPEEIIHALEQKSAAESKGSVIQVLSLAERKQADSLVAKLKSQGFEPYVTAMPDKSGRFRVRVRPNAGQSTAELEQKLKALGLKTWATSE
jgi:cell division septation protein DedD